MGYFDDIVFLGAWLDSVYTQPFDQRWPELLSLQYLVRGQMYFGRDGQPPVTLTGPSLYWIEPRHTYQLGAVGGQDARHLVLFRGARGERLIYDGFESLSSAGFLALREGDTLDALFRLLSRNLKNPTAASHRDSAVLLDKILIAIMAPSADALPDSPARQAVASITAALRARPDERHDLQALAAEGGLSFSHFRRLFRLCNGVPPHEFLLQCRMQAAAVALQDPGVLIKQVAMRCGYESAAEFSRAFKTRYGVSPNHYRLALGIRPAARQ